MMTNPFSPLAPLDLLNELFVGRRGVLGEFVEFLDRSNGDRIFIVAGERKSGRTSLLYQFMGRAERKGYPVAYIDVENIVGGSLISVVRTQVKQQIGENVQGTVFVALDNWQDISPAAIQELQVLSKNSQWLIALAVPSEFKILADEKVTYYTLGHLSRTDIETLVGRSFSRLFTDFPPGFSAKIYGFSGGHPVLVQAVCYELVEITRERGTQSILDDDILQTRQHLVAKDFIGDYISHLIRSLSKRARFVLLVFGETVSWEQAAISSDKLLASLNRWRDDFDTALVAEALEELCAGAVLVNTSGNEYGSKANLIFSVLRENRRIYLYENVWKPYVDVSMQRYAEVDLTGIEDMSDADKRYAIDLCFQTESSLFDLVKENMRLTYRNAPALLEISQTVSEIIESTLTGVSTEKAQSLLVRLCEVMEIGKAMRVRAMGESGTFIMAQITDNALDSTILQDKDLVVMLFQGSRFGEREIEELKSYLDTKPLLLLVVLRPRLLTDIRHALETIKQNYAYDIVMLSIEDLRQLLVHKSPKHALQKEVFEQIDLVRVSPFVTAGPVPDRIFFGRENELQVIADHAATASYAIIGGRCIGKTSILGRLRRVRLPSDGYRTFYYQCQMLPSMEPTCTQFLDAVVHKWLADLSDFAPSSFVDILARLPSDKPLIFLIDETDRLILADRAAGWPLFGELRALAESRRCQFVFTGERTLREAMSNDTSPLFNFANAMPLGCLDFPAVKELVTRPMKQLKIDLIDEATIVQCVWNFTSGHPSVVQRLCQQLVLCLNERRGLRLTPDDVESVIADPSFLRDDFYNVYLEQATVLERILSLVLAQEADEPYTLRDVCRLLDERLGLVSPTGEKPRAAEVDAALRRLTDLRSILDYTPQGYIFAIKAFPQVIARWGQVTMEDELMILTEKYRECGDLAEGEIEQKEAKR